MPTFLQRYYQQLQNATIEYCVVGEDGWPKMYVQRHDLEGNPVGDLTILEISSDEEGNAPGFIHGLPLPT